MDLKPFKLDIDDLIHDFAEGESTTLADMKRVWLSKKFSFIFEASPSTNLAFFMQSLYAHSIGYMVSTASLSHRLGGVYCLYCLYETQPFKPPFKIYLSLGELKGLKNLVIDAKEKGVKTLSALLKKMLETEIFLFGFVDKNEEAIIERVDELANIHNTRIQVAYRKLFENTRIEHFIKMDMGKEFEVDELKKMSREYADAKKQAIGEASEVVNVEDVRHIAAENQMLIGDTVEKTVEDWNSQKELYTQQTRVPEFEKEEAGTSTSRSTAEEREKDENNDTFGNGNSNDKRNYSRDHQIDDMEDDDDNGDFGDEIEQLLFSD